MTKFEELPVNEASTSSKLSSDDQTIIDNYIALGTEPQSVWDQVKPAVIATILYMILGNQWFAGIVSYLPYGDSAMNNLVIRATIFLILFVIIIKLTNSN